VIANLQNKILQKLSNFVSFMKKKCTTMQFNHRHLRIFLGLQKQNIGHSREECIQIYLHAK